MSSSLALRGARHLSTAASAAVKPTISQTKSRLRNVYDPDKALKIYTSFTSTNDASTSPASTRYAQELAVRRLAKSHRFSDIEEFLESHKSLPQIKDEAFLSSLIRSYGVVGMLENAVKTYDEMTGLGTPRSATSFNSLLYACVHSKAFDRVPDYFNELPAKYGFTPDKFSYGNLTKAYCEMGSPDIAIEKLQEMEEKGLEVGAVTFSTILHAFYKNGKSEEAEKFWDEMVTKRGCSPDVGVYNVRLSHIHGGKPEDVKALIKEMNNAGIKPDIISYNYLITCYASNDMLDEAEKVYNDLLKMKGVNPNPATYRSMVFNLCKKDRFMKAYKVFKQSVKVRKIPDFNSLKYLLEGLVKKGHVTEAKGMIRTVNKIFPSDLLKAWGKLAEDLGLGNVGTQEVVSEDTEKGSRETEKTTA